MEPWAPARGTSVDENGGAPEGRQRLRMRVMRSEPLSPLRGSLVFAALLPGVALRSTPGSMLPAPFAGSSCLYP